VGGSAGGLDALADIFSGLPEDFGLPILVVQHLHPSDEGSFAQYLVRISRMPVIEPCDKEPIVPGRVYAAPANYHMLVEKSGCVGLSVDARVNWSRPSLDVLFESAAHAWGAFVVAVILSGANTDGAQGMKAVKSVGGLTIAQDPATAEASLMPQAAIDEAGVDEILTPEEIGVFLRTQLKWRRDECLQGQALHKAF